MRLYTLRERAQGVRPFPELDPAESILEIAGIAAFALFAVIRNRDPRFDLSTNDRGDCRLYLGCKLTSINRHPPITRPVQCKHLGGSRQATYMRRQDRSVASLHQSPTIMS